MKAPGARHVVGRLIAGGPIGRRIRVRSILAHSSRGDLAQHRLWLKIEAAKGFLPVGLACLLIWLRVPVPQAVILAAFCAVPVWFVFVMYHDARAAVRMQRFHEVYMERLGVDTNLASVMGDRRLWKPGLTFREFVALRRRRDGPETS